MRRQLEMLNLQRALVEAAPTHPLIMKLEQHETLQAADRDLLSRMLADIRTFDSRRDIIRVGENPEYVHLMIEGWSCRYSIVDDGRRQITAFLVPGDFCDVHITMMGRMDHSIGALGRARVAFISKDLMAEVAERPALTRSLWWASLIDEGILRAWLVNMGRRDAYDRVAHLICELEARLKSVGIGSADRFELPLTQEDLGDALGLTPVHINRVLRRLRERNLMTLSNKTLTIENLPELRRQSGFDGRYLHLN
jgi:CRP-like cAMP-binding protein